MNDQITISKQEFSRLESEVKSVKDMLQGFIKRIDTLTQADEPKARTKLIAFLKQAHTQMPAVSDEEVWRDIEEAKEKPHGST